MITEKFLILNRENPEQTFNVLVCGNKNYGICDIVLPGKPLKPVEPPIKTKAYNEAKAMYETLMKEYADRRSRLLSKFIGRQLNSRDTRISLINNLCEELNK